MKDLRGATAIVTGASRGIGVYIARALAEEGVNLSLAARTESELEQVRTEMEALGVTAIATVCNVVSAEDRARLIERTETELGPVDILVNNAAAGGYKTFLEWSDRSIAKVIQVNFWAPWHLCARVLPGMRERGQGWIINVSSASAKPPAGPPFPPTAPSQLGTIYGGTKAFLDRWTASLAAEVVDDGIAVNTLAPQAAAATEVLVEFSDLPEELYEPLETMAEAALVLATADPAALTGRITYSLELLAELGRPTLDLSGQDPLPEWAPERIPERVEVMRAHALGRRPGSGRTNIADLGSQLSGDR